MLVTTLLAVASITSLALPAHAYSLTCGSYGSTPSFSCVSYTGFTGQRPWGYPVDANGHNCTNYASYRLWQNGVSSPGNLGNAMDWDNKAASYGVPVNNTPAVGSIAVWEANHFPAYGSGHVAYVEAVTSGYIDISEDNYGGTTMRARYNVGEAAWPDHFIHFKDVSPGVPAPTDTDADGTPDSTDLQPAIPGPVNNRGIPIESSRLSGDFNGDHIQDIAVFFNYSGGQTKLWLFPGIGSGNFGVPQLKWDSGAGSWWVEDIKPLAGDFNGDGLTDVGVLYNFGTQTQLWTFTSTTSGISAPVMKWDSGPGNWNWSATQQVVGDFNGDGLQDIAAFFDYGVGYTKLWWFASTGSGFSNPTVKWDSGPGNWWWSQSKPIVGDFTGDGKTDIAAFYNYGGGSMKLWVFPGTGSGNFGAPQMKWDSGPGNWWWSQIVPLAGDFNGDGIQDITVFYDHGNGLLRTWRFLGNGTGFNAPTVTWDSGAGSWWLKDVKPVVGDFDGDGRSDIAAFYNFGTRTSLWLFKSTSTSLGNPAQVWDSGPGNWNWSATLLL